MTATTLYAAQAAADAAKEAAGLDVVRQMPGAVELARLEAIIERNLVGYIEVGEALDRIRDFRMYRQAGYKNFDSYLQDRWGLSRSTAYRMIKASETAKLLPMGDRPSTERAARELVGIAPEHLKEIAATIDIASSTHAEIRLAVQRVVAAPLPDCSDPVLEANVRLLRSITRKHPVANCLFGAVELVSDPLAERIKAGETTICAAIQLLLPELIVKEDRWRAAEQK
jgi:hypothetical protein